MKTTTKFPKMVERMREIRDEISHDIMNMSLEEEKAYITEQLIKLKIKRSMTSDSVNSPE